METNGHTCVAVYAIDRGVTWPFKRRLEATSRRLELHSVVSSPEAEEGAVNICRYA
jgi:hypothetical protein